MGSRMGVWALVALVAAVAGAAVAAPPSSAAVGGSAAVAGAASVARTATVDGPAVAAATAARATIPARSLLVAATGDVLPENLVLDAGARTVGVGQRYAFGPLFAQIAPIIRSADLAICHVETPIGKPGERPGFYGASPFGGNLLLAPFEMAAAIAGAGFDRCSTSSNHSNDLGLAGIDSTLDALDAAGVTHAGTARSPTEADSGLPTLMTINRIRVAHLAYTTYSNTNPTAQPWQLNFAASVEQVAADVRRVRAAGAEIVIVSLHLFHELLPAPIPEDRAFATALTAAVPIDLVIHHGPHTIQPVERVNGAIVYWSVGNLVSGMGVPGKGRYSDPRTLDGLIATVRFTETSPGHFDAVSMPILVCDEVASRVVYA
ncbi:MAG: CapA family protein, partial [Ilumatobacteraceae bacterium]